MGAGDKYNLRLRLRIQETWFRNFRIAAGNMRQRSDDPQAVKMQDYCGAIEKSLYNAQQILNRR